MDHSRGDDILGVRYRPNALSFSFRFFFVMGRYESVYQGKRFDDELDVSQGFLSWLGVFAGGRSFMCSRRLLFLSLRISLMLAQNVIDILSTSDSVLFYFFSNKKQFFLPCFVFLALCFCSWSFRCLLFHHSLSFARCCPRTCH